MKRSISSQSAFPWAGLVPQADNQYFYTFSRQELRSINPSAEGREWP